MDSIEIRDDEESYRLLMEELGQVYVKPVEKIEKDAQFTSCLTISKSIPGLNKN